MEIINHLLLGITSAFSWYNLLACFVGTFIGTLVGVLPGIGPFTAVSLLLPLVYHSNAETSIIALAGIFYGTQYGGAITSILLKVPGESASVITSIDGYEMTKQGRGGVALTVSAISSFVAGIFATLLIAIVAVPLSIMALKFGSVEFASLMLLGIVISTLMSPNNRLISIAIAFVGVLISTIGVDVNTGIERFTLGSDYLFDGISFVIIAMSMFGLSEVIYNWAHCPDYSTKSSPVSNIYPTKQELTEAAPAIVRGSIVGSILGALPGAGPVISSFISYFIEKRISNDPESFGKGNIKGVAGPEAANNAGCQTSFIPMLSLGIPTTPVMAIMLAALTIHNIQPGPLVISNNPSLFWGLVVSMLIGNLFLLVLNIPLMRLWVSVTKIPRNILYICIIIACVSGTYFISGNWFNVFLLIPFTTLGYLFKTWGYDATPLAMGLVVGEAFEEHLRRSLILSQGDWTVFLSSPISISLLCVVGILIAKSFKL